MSEAYKTSEFTFDEIREEVVALLAESQILEDDLNVEYRRQFTGTMVLYLMMNAAVIIVAYAGANLLGFIRLGGPYGSEISSFSPVLLVASLFFAYHIGSKLMATDSSRYSIKLALNRLTTARQKAEIEAKELFFYQPSSHM